MGGTTQVSSLFEHEVDCGIHLEQSCDCALSRPYEDWEETHPPRRSKSARPVEGESGRSLFDIQRLIGRRGKRDK